MESNYLESTKELNSSSSVDASSIEKKIEEYLHRNTPRDANFLKSAKTLINNLHPKGIVHQAIDIRESGDDSRRNSNEIDGDIAKDFVDSRESSQTLIDRYTKLIKENEFLKKELEKKEMDLSALGPRYKYMEKHFEDFIRMKEEYEKLKEDKIKDGKILEMKTKGQQTWASTVICESCVKTIEIVQSPDFQRFIASGQNDAFCVTKAELVELEEKFNTLKESIAQREREYENRYEKAEIIHLTALNCKYRSQLADLHKKNKQNHNWANALQKIIAKICAHKELGDLTEQEQGWVDRIVDKYLSIEEATKQTAEVSESRDSLPTSDDHLER